MESQVLGEIAEIIAKYPLCEGLYRQECLLYYLSLNDNDKKEIIG